MALACMAFLAAGASQAQSLVDAYRQGLAADPRYRAVLYTTRATEALRDQAFAGFLPSVRFEAESVDTRQRIISSENPIFGPGTTDFPTSSRTLSLVQPLFRKDVIDRFEQAKASVQQASYTLLAAEQDLMLRTASAYLQVLAAQDALAFAAAEREALGRSLDLAREKLKSGLGTITVLHDATARHALAQAREIESRNKLGDARQALQEIIGAEPRQLQALRAELPLVLPEPASLEAWLQAAREGNLALRSRGAALEVAALEIDRQKAAHYPSLNMVFTQNRKDSGSTLFGGGSNVDTRELSLRLSVPLFEGGAVMAATKEASFKHLKAREELEQERRGLERQTRAAFEALVSGVGLVQALAQSVLAQQSAVAAREQGYAAGINTLLPVLDAQRDLFAARRDHAQARYDYLINRLKLAQAAGTLSETHMAELGAALE